MAPGQLPSAADEAMVASDRKTITLADVAIALLIVLATVVALKNLPGLVEIVMLQRLPLDAGSRYAIDTVLRYAIGIAGLFAAFSAIGLSWSNVQWLAAALTFGLAFGLQEIFANFISGLIILAERPIRIGDTVTVQNISGTVTRIRMRATTISDWDRKELVIPNKAFITGDVVNWTLSDPVLRISVPVGVSYGADVDQAERLLLSAAKAEESVLGDPAPYVFFTSFGESTLDFELRVFIPHIDYLVRVRHALHMRIIKAFREAGIEIAFPQRDIHVRSIDGLSDLVQRREAATPD
jgi:potassium efflux system protein